MLFEKRLDEIGAIARTIGWGAADILNTFAHDSTYLSVKQKKEGLVTAADLATNDYILQQLRIAFGSQEFGYLSEETYKEPKSSSEKKPLPQSWVWIIDPIDGTQAFIRRSSQYAVHIALVYEGRPVVAVVVVPETEKLYYAQKGGGAFVENRAGSRYRLQVSKRDRLEDILLLSRRTHSGERLHEILQKLPCQNKQYRGSIGCKIAAIAEQKADAFILLSGKFAPKDWDLAAPELILTESGGKFTRTDGTLLLYNQGDANQWGCAIASNGKCHEQLCAEVAKILSKL